MKIFIGAAIVIFGVFICVNADLSPEQKDKLKADRQACIAETGVDEELVNKARAGHFSDDPKSKAFAGCMARKLGFQDASGKVQPDVTRQILTTALNDPAAADQLIKACSIEGATPDETALATAKCYYDKTHFSLT